MSRRQRDHKEKTIEKKFICEREIDSEKDRNSKGKKERGGESDPPQKPKIRYSQITKIRSFLLQANTIRILKGGAQTKMTEYR